MYVEDLNTMVMSNTDSTRFKQWYNKESNRSKVLRRMKEYYEKNKSKIKKKRSSRSSQIRAYNKQYYKKNS